MYEHCYDIQSSPEENVLKSLIEVDAFERAGGF